MASKNIIFHVFEGPAGSGKTTLLKRLQNDSNIIKIPKHHHPTKHSNIRDYGVEAGASSFVKDWEMSVLANHFAYTYATTGKSPETLNLLIDRFKMSQEVYQQLRDMVKFPERHLIDSMSSAVTCFKYLFRDIWYRNQRTPPNMELIFHVLIPSRVVLSERRQLSGKHYPFDPIDEALVYSDLASLPVQYDSFVRVLLHYEEDPLERVKQWMG